MKPEAMTNRDLLSFHSDLVFSVEDKSSRLEGLCTGRAKYRLMHELERDKTVLSMIEDEIKRRKQTNPKSIIKN